MPTPRFARAAVGPLGAVLLVACSGGGSSTPPVQPVPTFSVSSTSPVDGEQRVGRGSDVFFTLSEPVPAIADGDVTVGDAAGPLAGALTTNDGSTWRWSAVRPLPLGARLELRLDPDVRSPSGARPEREVLASFTVEEPRPVVYELGPAREARVRAWNWSTAEARIVHGGQLLSPFGAGSMGALPVAGEWAAAARDDLGGWHAVLEASRRLVALDARVGGAIATTDLGPATVPLGTASVVSNRRGDAVLYTYRLGGATVEEQLFHYEARTGSWQPVALTPTTLDSVRQCGVDGLGNAVVAFVDGAAGALSVQRYAASTGASANEVVSPRVPGRYHVAMAESGAYQVVWDEPVAGSGDWRRLRRVSRDGALGAAQELERAPRRDARAFVSVPSGSAISLRETPDQIWILDRHEIDADVASQSDAVLTEPPERFDLCATSRGEAWLVFVGTVDGRRGVHGIRSRMGQAAEEPVLLLATDAPVEGLSASADEGGRLVVGLTERVNGALLLRAVVAE